MMGAWRTFVRCASGTRFAAWPLAGIHWVAPAGLWVFTHSKPNRLSRYWVVQAVGLAVQAPSRPLVTVSSALPLPAEFFQPRPCASRPAAVGSAPTWAVL